MTIKEVAHLAGITQQAVYKRIKAAGIDLGAIKDKETGQFTAEGEAAIMALFEQKNANSPEVERLRMKIEILQQQVDSLTSERDFLRSMLEQTNQLQAVTLAKLPGERPSFWARLFHRG